MQGWSNCASTSNHFKSGVLTVAARNVNVTSIGNLSTGDGDSIIANTINNLDLSKFGASNGASVHSTGGISRSGHHTHSSHQAQGTQANISTRTSTLATTMTAGHLQPNLSQISSSHQTYPSLQDSLNMGTTRLPDTVKTSREMHMGDSHLPHTKKQNNNIPNRMDMHLNGLIFNGLNISMNNQRVSRSYTDAGDTNYYFTCIIFFRMISITTLLV